MTSFAHVPQAPADIILGLNETFKTDTRPEKVNLGIGVYADEKGKLPTMQAITKAQDAYMVEKLPKPYIPIDGLPDYIKGVQKALFTPELLASGRILTVQTLGGTGAVKIGADFLFQQVLQKKDAHVYVSRPSWENHRVIFQQAGFHVDDYAYYDADLKKVNIDAMLADLRQLKSGSVCVFHVCCHNPTGADLSSKDWQAVIQICQEKSLTPFLDMAYQGFAHGLYEDLSPVHLFANSGLNVLLASSFSKSFSMYGERVGSLSVILADAAHAKPVLSQLKALIRGNYSNPPTHGALLVSKVLNDPELFTLWKNELEHMRQRIHNMREKFAEGLRQYGDFDFILAQQGMFSYSGLSAAQVERLREEFAIYAIPTGRICVAALNLHNMDHVVSAIQKVL